MASKSKKVSQDQELTEAWPANGSKKIWQPDSVSDNISKSLRSIDSTSSFDQSTKSQKTDAKKSGKKKKKKVDNDDDDDDDDDDDIGVTNPAFFDTTRESIFNSSTQSYGLLSSLRPAESLPQLGSPYDTTTKNNKKEQTYSSTPALTGDKSTSRISSSSGGGGGSKSNKNNQNNHSLKSAQGDYNFNNTTTSFQSSKMAARRQEDDYGKTLRATVEGNPDYDFVIPNNGPRPTTSTGHATSSAGREGRSDKPGPTSGNNNDATRKKMAGAVRLPIAESSDKSGGGKGGYSKPQKKPATDSNTRQTTEFKPYPESIPPEDVKDLSKLSVLGEDTINECLKARYWKDLIYTRCGDIMISVNPFKTLGIYTKETMEAYNHISISEDPHLYMISAKAFQDLKLRSIDQVILVSGESGAGKTEATKLLVQHVISMAGSDEASLQEKIIQVNPLLENFGNAKTVLNNNSSRFAKFLRLSFNNDAVVQSAKIQDFMLEKSRVIHYQNGESTYHSFYALLAGLDNPSALYISPGQMFRITGNFSSTKSRSATAYKEMYTQQQKVFELLDMAKAEREDVDVILAAILHIGDVIFEDDVNDCVIIQNEDTVQKVANLLDINNEKLTQALIERRGKVGREKKKAHQDSREFIQFSKKKRQADDERDALCKTLYEKLFGWIVRKINDALVPVRGSNAGSIGILDICGFEDVGGNTFEQLCINIINEHLQNFMNKKVIKDERELYEEEGISLGDIDTEGVNNDAVLSMFIKKHGILDSIDEDSKIEVVSNDVKMVRKLDRLCAKNELYIPATSEHPEFSIQHFAGKVKYDGTSFLQKNSDSLGELLDECLKASGSWLVQDMFHVEPSESGSISMSQYQFRGTKRGTQGPYRPLGATNLSRSINQSTRASLKSRFGTKLPSFKSDLSSKKTHIYYFKNSLEQLHHNMQRAIPHFVRCIKPNDNLKARKYETDRVLTQLRYNGITEIARIRSCGLPVRMVKKDFIKRYGDLVSASGDENDHVTVILQSVNAQASTFKIGKSQVFMTGQVQTFLDEDLTVLRRKQEEERRRLEEERKKREAEEREKREKLMKIERQQREEEEKQRKYIEDRQREMEEREKEVLRKREREEEEEERRKKRKKEKEEEEAKARKKAEEERMKAKEELRKELKTAKSVGFMEDIDEAPTPASSTYDSSVYNRAASDTTDSSRPPHGMSTETSMTVMSDVQDRDVDTLSNDYNNEWIDHFQDLMEEEVREDLSDLRTLKVVKVILYIFLALMLLISLVVQKVSFITLINELKHPDVKKGSATDEDKKIAAYFMLVLVLCIPYAVGFLLSCLKLLFGISKAPSIWTWIWVLGVESLHSVGLCLLVFRVMRRLDVFQMAYLMSATAVIPALLKLFFSDRIETKEQEKRRQISKGGYKAKEAFGFLLDFLAFAVQGTAAVAIVLLDFYRKGTHTDSPDRFEILVLVVGLVLASANQWENFTDGTLCGIELNELSWFKNKILKVRFELQESRNYPNTLAFLGKIGLTLLLAYLLSDEINANYELFVDKLTYDPNVHSLKFFTPITAATIGAFLAFNTSLMSLKLQMQRFSFALPLCLCTPATIAVLYFDCTHDFLAVVSQGVKDTEKSCSQRLMWGHEYNLIIFGGVWFLSLLIICRHIWRTQQDKNSDMNRLFLDPVYCGIMTSEQIMMNQRRHQNKIDENKKFEGNEITPRSVWYKINRLATFSSAESIEEQQQSQAAAAAAAEGGGGGGNGDHEGENGLPGADPGVPNGGPSRRHVTPKIYACATMWHETRTEMVQLLKSLHRLDLDQYLRGFSRNGYDPNYYEFEAHIFFDDAMERDDDNLAVPNKWVKDLVGSMTEACR